MRLVACIGLGLQVVACAAVAQAGGSQADGTQGRELRLPSGLEARFQDMLTDQRSGGGLTYRFRFIAEDFEAGDEALDKVMADLQWLCSEYALPRIASMGPQPGSVVISLADRPTAFGVHDPDVAQVFEAFTPKDGRCNWEMF